MKIELQDIYSRGNATYRSLYQKTNELILQVNGFSDQAKYSAKYLTKGQANDYLGGEIKRLTTKALILHQSLQLGFPIT